MRKGSTTVTQEERLGPRLARFVTLLGVVFAISAAVIVSQRLSEDALALIVGLLLAGIPLLGIIALLVFILVKVSQREPRQHTTPQQPMMLPPIIVQMPPQTPQLPTYGDPTPLPQHSNGRMWDVIGEEE
ncbi:MAG TPA: hypothetical protein PKH77_04240 [Anaerolineae bacterium]|nr:hypothetical protein [Anaerolineae bacterium]